MGDMADLDHDRFLDYLAGVGEFDEFEEDDQPLLLQLRKEMWDMKCDRDRTFGDQLMGFLERRKQMGRAERFFDKWRT